MANLRRRNPSKLLGVTLRLRAAVEAAGLTQEELAQRAGIHQTTVGAILRRGAKPRLDVLLSLLEVLDVSADWLLLDRGSPTDRPHKSAPRTDERRGAIAALEDAEQVIRQLQKKWR